MVGAFVITFVILILESHNIVLSLMQVLMVLSVIASVLAVIVFNGWEFGTAESGTIVMIIGLSVDYVVHLGTDYMRAPHASRGKKM